MDTTSGNQDRHKISDKFVFQPDLTINFLKILALECLKNGLYVFVRSSSLLQLTRTDIKSWTCSIFLFLISSLRNLQINRT